MFVCEPRSPRLPGAVTVPQAHHYLYDSTAFDAHIYGSGAPEVGSSPLQSSLLPSMSPHVGVAVHSNAPALSLCVALVYLLDPW
jgi:hypothetical protein